MSRVPELSVNNLVLRMIIATIQRTHTADNLPDITTSSLHYVELKSHSMNSSEQKIALSKKVHIYSAPNSNRIAAASKARSATSAMQVPELQQQT